MTTGRNKIEINEYSWKLTNGAAAVKGEEACLDTSTGLLTVVSASTTLLSVGRFAETMTGNGTTKCRVQLPMGIMAELWNNDDSPNDVAADDVGNTCYMKDGKTVSTLSTSRSAAGIVVDYLSDENRVAVLSGLKVAGATGAGSIFGSVADRAALAAIGSSSRTDGQTVLVRSDLSVWTFVAAETASIDGTATATSHLIIAPSSGTGRWVRARTSFTMKIAIDYTMADARALCTVPTGYCLKIMDDPHWDVVTGFTGGSSSAIGISTSNAAGSTKGDILGGAAGDVTATLGTAGIKAGTAGAKMDTIAHRRAFLLVAADTIRFDRITSVFTAGAGYVEIPVSFHKVG